MKRYLFIFVVLFSNYVISADEKTSITSTSSTNYTQFIIPIKNTEYTWYKKSTPDNHEEYACSVRVGEYSFGYSIFKFPGIPEEKGDINMLLRSGQTSVWKVSNDSGELLEDHSVKISYNDNSLVITIDNPETHKLIFENNPKSFKVNIVGFEHNNKSPDGQF